MRGGFHPTSEGVLLKLEIRLRVVADRTLLRSGFALDDRAAVAALPFVLADAHPDLAGLDVLRKFQITLFVFSFDFSDLAEFISDVGKALGVAREFLYLAVNLSSET